MIGMLKARSIFVNRFSRRSGPDVISMLNRLFKLEQHHTTVGRELQAGLTTFAAMAYILAVNPAILANTGMDKAALVTVTALTAAISTAIMAVLTNFPIA